ncbi:MAG: hypothetical protein JXR60_06045 [Bacteroidales bacterium]|nr:hypothetical protein [Bacteroidales bacterium]
MKKKDIKLFVTAFLQVSLVSANIYFVGHHMLLGIAFTGFTISYLWTINVKRIAISNIVDRLTYSFGAMAGSIIGVFAAQFINSYL